jgi:hypothetical protein
MKSPSIGRVIKLRRLGLAGYVAQMERQKCIENFDGKTMWKSRNDHCKHYKMELNFSHDCGAKLSSSLSLYGQKTTSTQKTVICTHTTMKT